MTVIIALYLIVGGFIVFSMEGNTYTNWDRLTYAENFFIAIFWPAWLTFYWFALQRRKRQPAEEQ